MVFDPTAPPKLVQHNQPGPMVETHFLNFQDREGSVNLVSIGGLSKVEWMVGQLVMGRGAELLADDKAKIIELAYELLDGCHKFTAELGRQQREASQAKEEEKKESPILQP